MEAKSNSSQTVSKPNREFFPQLTSVRFFAAFMVVLYHYEKLIADFFPAPMKNAIHHGFVGVSFFFILSGYILGSNYYDKFSDSSYSPAERKRQRIDFFWARLARIYPLYLVSILVMVPRVFMNPANDPHPEHIQFFFAHPMWSVLGHVFALQSFDHRIGEIFNAPTWSISTEFLFYFCFPLIVPRVARVQTKRLAATIFALFLLGMIFPIAYHSGVFPMLAKRLGLGYTADFDNQLNQWIRMMFLFRLPEFVMGVLCFRWYREILVSSREQSVSRFGWVSCIAGLLFLGFICLQPGSEVEKTALLSGQVLGVPFFLSAVLFLVLSRGVLVRFLSLPWLVLLGEASFALYLIHLPIKQFVRFILPRVLHINPETPWVLAITIVFTIILSIPVFKYLETPARKILMKWRKERISKLSAQPASPIIS